MATTLISSGFSALVLLIMAAFGLYTRRNSGWVLLSLLWGAAGYGVSYLIHEYALQSGLDKSATLVIILPILQQVFTALGVWLIVRWENFNNLVDGAVYGFAAGMGYAILKNLEYNFDTLETAGLRAFATTLVLATASGIVGVVTTQFHFQEKPRRTTMLLAGLSAGISYTVAFNLLIINNIGGNILPVAFGIGGITLVGLYVTGQLRRIIIRLGVEKRRADGLLDIVIPIGVELTTEKNFNRLLEKMLFEAKNFCNADGGTFYLVKDKQLEFAVMINDTLNIKMGGQSGQKIAIPPLELYNENGKPNMRNVAVYSAITGEVINIADSYEDDTFDFSGAREFDEKNKYASVSFLTIPLKNSRGEVQGVLQLLNALDSRRKKLVPFDANLQQLMQSFSSLASAALEGYITEQSLRREIQQLKIQIDQSKREREVAEITDNSFFKELQQKAKELRNREKTEPDIKKTGK